MLEPKKLVIKVLIILFVFSFLPVSVRAANIGDAFRQPLKDVAESTGAGYKSNIEPETVIGNVIKIALSFVGVISLVLMIYGGFLWMTAKGNEQQVEKAKNLFTAVIIGLIIVLSAYAISYFILEQVGEGTLTPHSAGDD